MTEDQITVSLIVAAAAALFVWGRWRHDLVALAALLACVAAGLTPAEQAFSGFGHPAVITVACVLILSRGLQNSGAVEHLARWALPSEAPPGLAVAALTGLAAALSAFMNNVGALALLMPVALKLAARAELAPARVLMPLAFGSILGGMTTLIGTPPNLIVSAFRDEAGLGPFGMFAFTPVGGAVALAGLVFVALAARRLVPDRDRAGVEGFDTGAYVTEARVGDKAKAVGMTLGEIETALDAAGAQALGLIRRDVRLRPAPTSTRIEAGDVLLLEAEPDELTEALAGLGLTLSEGRSAKGDDGEDDRRGAEAVDALVEYALTPQSPLAGRSAAQARLRSRFGVSVLAISRQGRRSVSRIRAQRLRAGDVVLAQGAPEALAGFAADMRLAPLADRGVALPDARRAGLAVAILAGAVLAASLGAVPAAVAFAAAALAAMVADVTPPREAYQAVDWPVIVLLGALIPVAQAMADTGAAALIAGGLIDAIGEGRPILALAALLVATMTLSDFINNAAVAAAMCPVALGVADRLGAAPDAFLMAVAVGASCAFLTPIGHQNNTLILGPGGLRFRDFWPLGLPLEVIVVAVAVPMLALVWPL